MTSPLRLFQALFLSFLLPLLLCQCAGYRVGSIGGKEIQGIRTLYIPMAENETYTPDVAAYVTNETIRAFDNDGTLRTEQSAHADAELLITITRVERQSLRPTRQDVLVTAEYALNLQARITLINRRLGKKIIDQEMIQGHTTFFVQQDLIEAQRQALPLAAIDLARNISLRITEGW